MSLVNLLSNKNFFVQLVSGGAGHNLGHIDNTWQRAFSVFDVSCKYKQMLLHKAGMYGREVGNSPPKQENKQKGCV